MDRTVYKHETSIYAEEEGEEENVKHIKLSSDPMPMLHAWSSKSGEGVKLQSVSLLADSGCSVNMISKELTEKLNLK